MAVAGRAGAGPGGDAEDAFGVFAKFNVLWTVGDALVAFVDAVREGLPNGDVAIGALNAVVDSNRPTPSHMT